MWGKIVAEFWGKRRKYQINYYGTTIPWSSWSSPAVRPWPPGAGLSAPLLAKCRAVAARLDDTCMANRQEAVRWEEGQEGRNWMMNGSLGAWQLCWGTWRGTPRWKVPQVAIVHSLSSSKGEEGLGDVKKSLLKKLVLHMDDGDGSLRELVSVEKVGTYLILYNLILYNLI